jgi:type IV pilus assembly protein PilX
MQNSSLQEKMAGNMRDRSLAFQAAESALRSGEIMLATDPMPIFVCNGSTDGLYISHPGASPECPTQKGGPSNAQLQTGYYPPERDGFWTSTNTDVLTLSSVGFGNLADNPKYVLEELPPPIPQTGSSLEAGTAIRDAPKYYRVTARGVGMTGKAVVILQSVVRY